MKRKTTLTSGGEKKLFSFTEQRSSEFIPGVNLFLGITFQMRQESKKHNQIQKRHEIIFILYYHFLFRSFSLVFFVRIGMYFGIVLTIVGIRNDFTIRKHWK